MPSLELKDMIPENVGRLIDILPTVFESKNFDPFEYGWDDDFCLFFARELLQMEAVYYCEERCTPVIPRRSVKKLEELCDDLALEMKKSAESVKESTSHFYTHKCLSDFLENAHNLANSYTDDQKELTGVSLPHVWGPENMAFEYASHIPAVYAKEIIGDAYILGKDHVQVPVEQIRDHKFLFYAHEKGLYIINPSSEYWDR